MGKQNKKTKTHAQAATHKQTGRGLGKGLSALMSESYSQVDDGEVLTQVEVDAAEAGGGVEARKHLSISAIVPGKFQPRRNFESSALSELAESIRKNGVMQPILVRPTQKGKFEIIAGERRWRASQMAGMDAIPAIVRDMRDELALELALVENIQRQDLGALEEAAGYQRLMDEFGYTQEMLATTVHKSRSHIANLLRLLSLPEEIRAMLDEEKLTMGHARALMNTENPVELAHEVVRKGLNVRQAEALANSRKPGREEKAQQTKPQAVPAEPVAQVATAAAPVATAPMPVAQIQVASKIKDPDILALEQTLSENLGLRVSIEDRGQSGEITIAYESLEQLDEILRRLGGSI